MIAVPLLLLNMIEIHPLQKQGPLRTADFENSSFLFHHTVSSILAQFSRDMRDRQAAVTSNLSSEAQPHSPIKQGAQVEAVSIQALAQQESDAPVYQAPQTSPAATGIIVHQSTAASDMSLSGTCHRSLQPAHVPGTGRRLPRINTRVMRGAPCTSAASTPAMPHDCGTSVFDRQTPREMMRSRSQPHESWVLCRWLAREGSLAWPGLPDGSGCREPHIDVEGIRLKSARAYTCARAISDRTCTTYTAANSSTAWLPLVNSANPALLDSVLTNAPCPPLGAGPSVLLSDHQHGKLQVHRDTQRCIGHSRPGSGAGMSCDAYAPQSTEKSTKVGNKIHVQEGKETRARAQEKLRTSTDAQPATSGPTAQMSPRNQRLENLSQVAIRVFSLPSTGSDAAHISCRASHLARGTGASDMPQQATQALLFAPSRHKAFPLMAELFSPVPSAQSWSQKSIQSTLDEAPLSERRSAEILVQDAEYDSPDEAAVDTIPADSSRPTSGIPMMTPVVVPHADK